MKCIERIATYLDSALVGDRGFGGPMRMCENPFETPIDRGSETNATIGVNFEKQSPANQRRFHTEVADRAIRLRVFLLCVYTTSRRPRGYFY